MKQEFYSLPLALEEVMQKKEHPKCTLQQSVAQHLHLILTTAFGELRTDENFGCSIWEYDFDNITSGYKLKEFIKQSLLAAVQQYEKRIYNVGIELMIRQEEPGGNAAGHQVKKRMHVTITGLLQATNESITCIDTFFTGPLSYLST
jgi:phage baseplate assembly protein W